MPPCLSIKPIKRTEGGVVGWGDGNGRYGGECDFQVFDIGDANVKTIEIILKATLGL